MKILVLVLSADFAPYDVMIDTAMQTWDSIEVEDVETIYYCGKSPKQNTDKIIYLDIAESYANMGHKALMAFEWILSNKEFDYVARVHSSIFVDKSNLKEYVKTLPESVFACVSAESQNGFRYGWGGVGFLLSRDVVQKIVDNKNLWKHQFMEDESLGLIVSTLGIPYYPNYAAGIDKMPDGWRCISYNGESISFTDFSDLKRLKHHFYRCKMDGQRDLDKYVMQQLFSKCI